MIENYCKYIAKIINFNKYNNIFVFKVLCSHFSNHNHIKHVFIPYIVES